MSRKILKNPLYMRKTILYNVASITALFFIWELSAKIIHSPFFPSFTDVVSAAIRIMMVGDIEGYRLSDHAFVSILRVLSGFGFACITGFPLGLIMGLRHETYDALKSVMEPLRFVPPIAWLPLVFLLLTGFSRYVVVIWLGAFFPILLNTIAGVKRTSPILVDVAKVFGADNRFTTFRVVVPSASPEVVSGMRIGLGVGWMCIVAAEMMGGEAVGLGRLIIKHIELLQIDASIVGIAAIGLIGLLINEAFLQIEKQLFKWRMEIKI